MYTSAKNLYKAIFHMHFKALQCIAELRESSIRDTASIKEHCDTTLVAKKCLELVKELQTQLNTVERLATNLVCLEYIKLGDDAPPNIKTVYNTATPNIGMMVKTPTKKEDAQKYAEFCRHFGITEETIENETFRPHWPAMVEYISELAKQGKPLPPHCDPASQYPVYKLTCRKTRDILDSGDMPD